MIPELESDRRRRPVAANRLGFHQRDALLVVHHVQGVPLKRNRTDGCELSVNLKVTEIEAL